MKSMVLINFRIFKKEVIIFQAVAISRKLSLYTNSLVRGMLFLKEKSALFRFVPSCTNTKLASSVISSCHLPLGISY